ncbi:MAG: hypothetical protein AOY29_12810 [Alcanivorax borkumensis]|jgi:cytoplasmic iron level regulating protein YaaA (DUF328/UPF0246 family)|uniref:UPF0246 protein ABO_1338 n=1 Tax=Alcanivorax borkumensis (strain ATCC 700651 / DSM 11573 / NCIMB 13689 / SK2) TaxID=393595 RepID=Y1338_ALCBS|nr:MULTISPECIES: peroxide stress protein YaaA [Alcanivorax]Q0VPW2.1 RecName: Full=UPF0246 protein ABO_1338 [Alcanivorax borkumensis SK2]OJH07726.1 MAG: hypothetical protein AOY29_12810 [Alcanivorax borkumensis]EUC71225.1 hypothetical protein Y017_00180 [Alcanivorax sp. 97CO-5]PKG02658.1 peroxide stress protein YaaA [Alcanivorax sp. 97CO-6]CAL16786.1 conserved hypothetical protein [Alcanivorax borkumensis SK2]BAP14262.1 hypothetical protein AS19_14110 [Alcanivorax sp. NBRC 101098]
MLIVVSPAKTLDYESELPALKTTQPRLLDDSEALIARARQLSPADISSLMGVSDKIAHLNAERFSLWERPFNKKNARPAAFAFKGDVYTGLDIESFNDHQLSEAQQRFRMLSGLYGVLRPLDLMQAYRLEMGTKLDNERGKDLYAFWGNTITELLNKDMKDAKTDVLVNLASNEYFKAVKKKAVAGTIIEPVFQDEKNGNYKIISFYAKKARGLMAAWIIKKGLKDPAKLTQFDVAGYCYCEAQSTALRPVFRRPEQG